MKSFLTAFKEEEEFLSQSQTPNPLITRKSSVNDVVRKSSLADSEVKRKSSVENPFGATRKLSDKWLNSDVADGTGEVSPGSTDVMIVTSESNKKFFFDLEKS
jgi:hypothetical protein